MNAPSDAPSDIPGDASFHAPSTAPANGRPHLRLRTERLTLRRFSPADLPHLTALCGDPQVMRYLDDGRPLGPGQVAEQVLPALLREYGELPDGLGRWAVQDGAGRFLGWAALRPAHSTGLDPAPDHLELGYRLLPSAWGRGYAGEAARALVRAAFEEQRAGRVVATTMAVNSASRRVLERAGLRHVRTFFADWPDPIPGSEHGDVVYELDRAEWAGPSGG